MSRFCEEIDERIEERVQKPVEKWVERRREKCKKRKCKKWCLCCNKWLCWVEVFFEKVIQWVVVIVVRWVTRLVCEVFNGLLNLAGLLLGLLFAFPILGRGLRELWDIFLDLGLRAFGLLSLATVADIIGWEWRKRLRICVIILNDNGVPLATQASLNPFITTATTIFDQQANVELIVEGVITLTEPSPDYALNVGCDWEGWWDDLWLAGAWYEITANAECFDGAGRRLIGWFSPVVVFVVKNVSGKSGCSMGPASDYVVIEGGNPVCFAHEIGHACGLWHHSDTANLMFRQCGGQSLKKWQRVLLRNSRHVSYL